MCSSDLDPDYTSMEMSTSMVQVSNWIREQARESANAISLIEYKKPLYDLSEKKQNKLVDSLFDTSVQEYYGAGLTWKVERQLAVLFENGKFTVESVMPTMGHSAIGIPFSIELNELKIDPEVINDSLIGAGG